MSESNKTLGYLPQDTPPIGATLSLGLQQVLTMFPATVLVAILTKFDVGTTLLASGLGTIIALLVSKRRIPMYYGSSFSYMAVIMAAATNLGIDCSGLNYCPDLVRVVQVGIILTGVLNILIGLVVQKVGKRVLDVVLPPIVTGSMAITIGIALAGAALAGSGSHWGVAFITLIATILFSVFLRGKGLLGMLPILFGAIVGYAAAAAFNIVDYTSITSADWLVLPNVTLPAFGNAEAWGMGLSIALIAIATIPESTAHLYQMSLYIDELAKELKKPELKIKDLIGLNLVADGCNDVVNGFLGGCAGTNYGENNSLMAITRNYSVPVLMTAGAIAIVLAFFGKLAGIVYSIPAAVTGGLSIYLFGVIGMQGIALMQSEKVDLFDPKNLAIGSVVLITGIGGNMMLEGATFPFKVPYLFPDGIPAIVFAAILGIALNLVFILFDKKETKA